MTLIKKTIPIAVVLCLALENSFCQDWFNAKDTLKYSTSSNSIYYFKDRFYDTCKVLVRMEGSSETLNAYKLFFIIDGQYTDNKTSFNVFITADKKRKLFNVSWYKFYSW